MRIKFRAWDKDIKTFVQVMDWIEEFKNSKLRYLGKEVVVNSDSIINLFTVLTHKDIELMQYTGIKDCNGKEIYEDDIVKVKERIAGEDLIGKVIYDETEGCYWIVQGNENNYFKIIFDLDYEHYVIGNIYENKNLLEE